MCYMQGKPVKFPSSSALVIFLGLSPTPHEPWSCQCPTVEAIVSNVAVRLSALWDPGIS